LTGLAQFAQPSLQFAFHNNIIKYQTHIIPRKLSLYFGEKMCRFIKKKQKGGLNSSHKNKRRHKNFSYWQNQSKHTT